MIDFIYTTLLIKRVEILLDYCIHRHYNVIDLLSFEISQNKTASFFFAPFHIIAGVSLNALLSSGIPYCNSISLTPFTNCGGLRSFISLINANVSLNGMA